MALPLTETQKFYNACAARFGDLRSPISDEELRLMQATALQEMPDAPPEEQWLLWLIVGLTEQYLGNLEASLEANLQALVGSPAESEVRCNVGSVLGLLNRHEEALTHFLEAERAATKGSLLHLGILCNLVAARSYLGEYEAAADLLVRVSRMARPEEPEGFMRVAMAAAVLGHGDQAVEYFARFAAAIRGEPRGERSAAKAILGDGTVDVSRIKDPLRGCLERALAKEAMTSRASVLSRSPARRPTADEIARATEQARDADGNVDPFELAELLAVPRHGVIRSDDPLARFPADGDVKRRLSAHA